MHVCSVTPYSPVCVCTYMYVHVRVLSVCSCVRMCGHTLLSLLPTRTGPTFSCYGALKPSPRPPASATLAPYAPPGGPAATSPLPPPPVPTLPSGENMGGSIRQLLSSKTVTKPPRSAMKEKPLQIHHRIGKFTAAYAP